MSVWPQARAPTSAWIRLSHVIITSMASLAALALAMRRIWGVGVIVSLYYTCCLLLKRSIIYNLQNMNHIII